MDIGDRIYRWINRPETPLTIKRTIGPDDVVALVAEFRAAQNDALLAARLEANRREGCLTHEDIWRACPYQAEFGECIYPACDLKCKGRFIRRSGRT